ncbi:MAG: hypothetical protein EXR75_05315 [Myxococcales bacterium]|nr:hypothetical protein [Myxococcales bacterium]
MLRPGSLLLLPAILLGCSGATDSPASGAVVATGAAVGGAAAAGGAGGLAESATSSDSSVTTTASAGGGSGGTGGTGGAGGAGGASEAGWRSVLYPKDWVPGFATPAGHRVQDYSYAGYKNGAVPFGAPVVTTVHDVTMSGVDATGGLDATAKVQALIDSLAAVGGVVYFPAGTYRFDGRLKLGASKLVLRGDGPKLSKLYFTKATGMAYLSHITFSGSLSDSAEALLTEDGHVFATDVAVPNASAFKPGDDVVIGWVITPEFIAEHQMTGTWDHSTNAFHGKWQPFFRRNVISVDLVSTPNRVVFDVPLRYETKTRDLASIRKQAGYLSECGVEHLGLGNAVGWDDAWAQNQVHVLELAGTKDCWVHDVASFDPPTGPTSGNGADAHLQSGGLIVQASKRVTVADGDLSNAENRGGGGNGYLFEVRQSSEVLFRDLVGSAGRHNFIQNWGFGVTGCVWLRVKSKDGNAWLNKNFPGLAGLSEFHHSLAHANLFDASSFDDGLGIVNREAYSSYSGHTGTENTIWNTSGKGLVRSRQFGTGYVVGTKGVSVDVKLEGFVVGGVGTAPVDFTEGVGEAADLVPQSLYEDQLARRLGP